MSEHRVRLSDKDLALIELAIVNNYNNPSPGLHHTNDSDKEWTKKVLGRFRRMRKHNTTGRPDSKDQYIPMKKTVMGSGIDVDKYNEELKNELELEW
ncbi:hypothetical protein AKJ66_00380 [candidate division MSBL1 archaeon SCGC-AAA259E22]|uniref:Uncharacterized protein n=1 Tax=candidate division MSBL1 archaeon SCGC-AAA259E22 TaxID=1698265 RepID=A0A133UI86_9EURY|nr:hypothetical protein AKJ66_00380 [candidate division MSBL1 archaeon SCGC-AAA259E22]